MSGFEREAAKLRKELAEVRGEVDELRAGVENERSERILLDAALISTISSLGRQKCEGDA